MSPQRIQRKRVKGWRMPEGAVYVGRPTAWGNPFVPHEAFTLAGVQFAAVTQQESVDLYRRSVEGNDQGARFHRECPTSEYIREHLAGKDLACWCSLEVPCHADVLLSIANGDAP